MLRVKVEVARRFLEDCLMAVGTPKQSAVEHADLLIHADLAGHFSHGMNRLGFYINDILSGSTDPKAQPAILKETAATAWVDGCNGLGAPVGNFCMDVAICKAKQSGVGWVSAKRCNHFGMAGWWSQKASKEGLIGMAFTNTSPLMVPTRAKDRALGTNPLAMSAPACDGDSLMVDMATTAVALGKIEVANHKKEPIPEGWALAADGKPTTDPMKAYTGAKLLPLGGLENTSGYKGYCLGAIVETFCSGLAGTPPSHKIRSWDINSEAGPPNLGQCFVAINPDCFAPGFGERIAECLQHWRGMEPVDPSLPVLAPGDKEAQTTACTLQDGTISYSQGQIDTSKALAERLKIKPLEVLRA